MDLQSFKKQVSGRKFGELVLHHVKKQSYNNIIAAIQGTTDDLPQIFKHEIEMMIDLYNQGLYDVEFWKTDCGESFDVIVQEAQERFDALGIEPSDNDLFNAFNLIVLNFASAAQLQPAMKKFIRKAVNKGIFG